MALEVYLPSSNSFIAVRFRDDENMDLFRHRVAKVSGFEEPILAVNGRRIDLKKRLALDYYRPFGDFWVAIEDPAVNHRKKWLADHPALALSSDLNLGVKTLTGKTISIRATATWTVAKCKEFIQDREGIPPDQQRLIFGGRQMADNEELCFYQVDPNALLHLVLRLCGGGTFPFGAGMGMKFADVSSSAGTTKLHLSETAAAGREVDKGTNIELRCSCTKYDVIACQGYGTFDLIFDGAKVKCPNCCKTGGKLETVGFYDCKYKTHGIKLGSDGPILHESEWKTVSLQDEYQLFDTKRNVAKVNWIRLVIESKPSWQVEECPICLEHMEGGNVQVMPKCGHAFHPGCIEEWQKSGRNCPCCRQAV